MNKIKIFTIVTCMVVFSAIFAHADDTLNFSWDANTDNTTGYSVVMDSSTNIVVSVDGRDTTTASYTITGDAATECHTFAVFAHDDKGNRSFCSDFRVWCPNRIVMPPLNFTTSSSN